MRPVMGYCEDGKKPLSFPQKAANFVAISATVNKNDSAPFSK
jgi:hypothetical protein